MGAAADARAGASSAVGAPAPGTDSPAHAAGTDGLARDDRHAGTGTGAAAGRDAAAQGRAARGAPG